MKRKNIKGFKVRVFDTRYPFSMSTTELHKLIQEERTFDDRLEAFIRECKLAAKGINEENRPRRYYDLSLKLHDFLRKEGIDFLSETSPEQPRYRRKSALLQRFGKEVLRLKETDQLTNVRAVFLFPILEPDPSTIDWGIAWYRRFELLRLHGANINPEDPIFAEERKRLERLVAEGKIATREELRQLVTRRAMELRGSQLSSILDGQTENSGHI